MRRYVVVHCCTYDGVDVHGPFATEDEASRFAASSGGKPRKVVYAGGFTTDRRFVAIEACLLGGITVYGWFATRQAAEAFCHRQSGMSSPGVQFAAAAVS